MSVTNEDDFNPREAETDTVYPEAPKSPSVPPSDPPPPEHPGQDKIDEVMESDLEPADRRMPTSGQRGEGEEAGQGPAGGNLPDTSRPKGETAGHG